VRGGSDARDTAPSPRAAFSPSARSAARLGVRQGATLGDFTAKTNAGADKKLSDYAGKVVLIENVASL